MTSWPSWSVLYLRHTRPGFEPRTTDVTWLAFRAYDSTEWVQIPCCLPSFCTVHTQNRCHPTEPRRGPPRLFFVYIYSNTLYHRCLQTTGGTTHSHKRRRGSFVLESLWSRSPRKPSQYFLICHNSPDRIYVGTGFIQLLVGRILGPF